MTTTRRAKEGSNNYSIHILRFSYTRTVISIPAPCSIRKPNARKLAAKKGDKAIIMIDQFVKSGIWLQDTSLINLL